MVVQSIADRPGSGANVLPHRGGESPVSPKSRAERDRSSVILFSSAGAALYLGLSKQLKLDEISSAVIAIFSACSAIAAYSRFQKSASASEKKENDPHRASVTKRALLVFFSVASVSTALCFWLNCKIPKKPNASSQSHHFSSYSYHNNHYSTNYRYNQPAYSAQPQYNLPSMSDAGPILLGGAVIGIVAVAYRCLCPAPYMCLIGMEPIPADLLVSIAQGEAVNHYNLFNLVNWFLTSGSIRDPVTNLNMPDQVIDHILSYFDLPRRTFIDILNAPQFTRLFLFLNTLSVIAGLPVTQVNYRRRLWEYLVRLNQETQRNN